MVNTPTILNVNGTGPALLHIPTDTAHVLSSLRPENPVTSGPGYTWPIAS